MKRTKENLEHQIQLKQTEIDNYRRVIQNYPLDRMNRCGKPYLQRLENELQILKNQIEDREGCKETKAKLGYTRIGLKNV